MKHQSMDYHQGATQILILIVVGVLLISIGSSFGHGGKTHAGAAFSSFEAVQKAVNLYNRLIVSKKLPEEWETMLESIHVTTRGPENSRETIVQFKRSNGNPDSVFFFFNDQGDYSGSNFSGE